MEFSKLRKIQFIVLAIISCQINIVLLLLEVNSSFITNYYYENQLFINQNQAPFTEKISIPELYSLEDASKIVEPLWPCRRNQNMTKKTKLVFVHIFKTAGSSIRRYLLGMSTRCRVSNAVVIHCAHLSSQSLMGGGEWISENHPCQLKFFLNREKKFKLYRGQKNVTSGYIWDKVDVLGGHLPLGALETNYSKGENIRYFTFFRNSIEKYVSGKIFVMEKKVRNITTEFMVNLVKSDVNDDVQKGVYFLKTAEYILTPFQKNLKLNVSAKTEIMMNNIIKYNVLVGLVNRWSESLELLHYIFGNRKKFDYVRDQHTNKIIKNQSIKVSTSAVVRELKKDVKFYETILEFVKYDQMIVDFAQVIHLLQYEAFQKHKKNHSPKIKENV